ncbi:Imidazoleglycerol-phosphate dehydratase [Candidatus Gugararchaeum adminiculabundum]|nr:Imidazoleglycerol-phosphate dehydratase [Candidatus Gugararchaeum adminiculabundum]
MATVKGRKASILRKTCETGIKVELNIDGKGKAKAKTGIGFFDHMLEAFAKHGGLDLKVLCTGDLEVDQHHTVEDIGIAIGNAFEKALGNKKGINRAGFYAFPLDESLSIVAIDFGGRSYTKFECKFNRERIGELESESIAEFFFGFAQGARANVHVRLLYGGNDHHKCESLFKAFAKAVKMACSIDKRMRKEIPSTKGVI